MDLTVVAADKFKLSVSVPVVEEGTGRGRVVCGGDIEGWRWGFGTRDSVIPVSHAHAPSQSWFAAAHWREAHQNAAENRLLSIDNMSRQQYPEWGFRAQELTASR